MLVLIGGTTILALNMGVRQSLGLFIPEMMADLGMSLGTFSLALALQNLIWGLLAPATGAIADRFGTAKTLIAGSMLYVLGLALMAFSTEPWMLHGSAGLLVGMGVSATTFAVVLGAVGRCFPERRRTLALGVASSGGSLGQFIMAPVSQGLIDGFGWAVALLIIALIAGLMIPASAVLAGRAEARSTQGNLKSALHEAIHHRGYRLLFFGFFVCGFHVAFISVHLPNFVAICGLPATVASSSLAIIGLFNIGGTIIAGALGDRYRKSWLLSAIYASRAILILVFMLAPKTPDAFFVFSAVMGVLWLSTVPLTSGIVAHLFGPRYMATLFGLVMLSHQLGAFLGAWIGGVVFDATGNYDLVWLLGAALGFIAAVLHLPIREDQIRSDPQTLAS